MTSPTQLLVSGDGLPDPIEIASIELLESSGRYFVRCTASDGAVGMIATPDRMKYLYPMISHQVIPYFLGKDARMLDHLIEGVYLHSANYKLSGAAFGSCVAWVEFSVLDLLGKATGRPVHELLGPTLRRRVPIYLSSLRRDTTPEEELAWLEPRIEDTGACAIKLKIGGRMSQNEDAFPGRTDGLVRLARERWGDDMVIYVDANGSYDAPTAVRVGDLLADHGVAWFEEPCPFEDLEETKAVSDALDLPVAGGEQDSSLVRFRTMIERRIVDVVQPDLSYNGGFIRTLHVARMAQGAGMPATLHSAAQGMHPAYMLHFAAVTPNIGPFQEYNAAPEPTTYITPTFQVIGGAIAVPDGPGFGVEIDPALLSDTNVLAIGTADP